MAKVDLDRAMKYPAIETLKYSEVITPSLGFVTDAKGSTAASSIRLAAQLRELERASPTLLLKAMDDLKNVSAVGRQKLGTESLPAISYTDMGTKFTILFDPKTHLPAAIRTLDDDNITGDSNYDLVLSDWKPVGGVKVAHTLTYNLNGLEVAKVTYKEVTANPPLEEIAFVPPTTRSRAAKAPADGTCSLSVGAAADRVGSISRRRHVVLSTQRASKIGGTRPKCSAGSDRRRQQSDRRHEGRPRNL